MMDIDDVQSKLSNDSTDAMEIPTGDRTDCCIGTDMPILAYYLCIINKFCTLYWIKTDI